MATTLEGGTRIPPAVCPQQGDSGVVTGLLHSVAGYSHSWTFWQTADELNNLGLILDEHFRLWFSENGFIDVLLSTDTLVEQILKFHYGICIARQVSIFH